MTETLDPRDWGLNSLALTSRFLHKACKSVATTADQDACFDRQYCSYTLLATKIQLCSVLVHIYFYFLAKEITRCKNSVWFNLRAQDKFVKLNPPLIHVPVCIYLLLLSPFLDSLYLSRFAHDLVPLWPAESLNQIWNRKYRYLNS